jgi:adenosylhomocysteine nucleosidase
LHIRKENGERHRWKTSTTTDIENFGAICCEMEGVGVAQAAWLNDVPYVVLRAISDKADDDGRVDFRSFLTSSAKRCADIVVHLALHAQELL